MTNVIPFPTLTFTLSDRAELARWGSLAPSVAGWWVQQDPDDGSTIATSGEGTEFVVLVQGGPYEPGSLMVEPSRRGWELRTWQGELAGVFRTLREALESVCRTIWTAA